jgi:spore coat polysaccharide biosynthesis protein SpsF
MYVGDQPMVTQTVHRAARAQDLKANVMVIVPPADELLIGRVWSVRAPPVPEDDVLARFFHATTSYQRCDPIVRLTADCPLIDPAVIDRALEEYDGTRLVVSTVAPEYTEGYPDGQDVEVFSREMLEEAFATPTAST